MQPPTNTGFGEKQYQQVLTRRSDLAVEITQRTNQRSEVTKNAHKLFLQTLTGFVGLVPENTSDFFRRKRKLVLVDKRQSQLWLLFAWKEADIYTALSLSSHPLSPSFTLSHLLSPSLTLSHSLSPSLTLFSCLSRSLKCFDLALMKIID